MTEDDKLRFKGYTIHDGGLCPLSDNAQPGAVLIDGTVIVAGTLSANRIDWSKVRAWKVSQGNTLAGLWSGGQKSQRIRERLRGRA